MTDVLLVEDHDGDVLLVQEATEALDEPVRLHVVSDGVEALKFLRHEEPYQESPQVRLVLLDANTPKMDACEVLTEVREDQALRSLPIVVFSSSASPTDIRQCLEAGASAYVVKPASLDEFIQAVQNSLRFWTSGLGSAPVT